MRDSGGRVLGVGIDLCELDRIQGLWDRMGERFLNRAYNPAEIDYIRGGGSPARRSAMLFAAKEAVVKCLGTGFSAGVGWKQVEVVPDPGGGWQVILHAEAERRARLPGATHWSIDLQLTRDHAVAVAIWSLGEGSPVGQGI